MTVVAGGTLPLQFVLGRCDDMRAEVFVRVAPPGEAAAGLAVGGTLTGPRSRLATTLPVTAALVDRGSGLAHAILTEPSFWTPELPNLYRLQVRVTAGDRLVAGCDRFVGLRRLGIKGRSFWLDGRRYVARGRWCDAAAYSPGPLHESRTAAVVADPDPAVLTAADEAGVAVLALLTDSAGNRFDRQQATDRLAAWALHPAVLAAVLPESMTVAEARAQAADLRRLKGTMLLGMAVDGERPPPEVADGIDFLVPLIPTGTVPHATWRHASPPLPLVAWRRSGAAESGRAGCDALQAALAAWGLAEGTERLPWDWAGYVVS